MGRAVNSLNEELDLFRDQLEAHNRMMTGQRVQRRLHPSTHHFAFATGIENSYPVINGPDGKPRRIDQMEKARHYDRWREDFMLVLDLGLEFLRYGPPYYKTHVGPGKYDWEFTDDTLDTLHRIGITPIVDLCHFGVPDWVGDFQNTDWPMLFAEYARAFAERYPWVHLYTPINEIYICAKFSALFGWWNERLRSDGAFVTAMSNLVRANILAEEAILEVQPRAYFIQSESSEYFHPAHPDPDIVELSEHLNHLRFLSLDLCYGHHEICWCAYEYLMDNGMTRDEFRWFNQHGRALKPHHVMGNDYYITNEHLVHRDGSTIPATDVLGYYVITKQYFDRYHLPVMHTETNMQDANQAPAWLWKQWTNMVRLKQDGVPIVGFTWYSLIDQVDWDSCLRFDRGNVNPLGLYDMDRKIRPVGQAYKQLVAQWRNVLPGESIFFDARISRLND
jgi:beta-glucosidase/6-phospho-beta-glucosidase/beta-galactosidase